STRPLMLVTYIGYFDREQELLFFPYYIDRGVRPESITNIKGRPWDSTRPTEWVIENGALLSGTPVHIGGKVQSPGAEEDLNQSFLGVPFTYRGERHGVVSVQS